MGTGLMGTVTIAFFGSPTSEDKAGSGEYNLFFAET